MSESRRLRRQNERGATHSRKLDWVKVRKASSQILLFSIIFFMMILIFSYFNITSNNNLRNTIAGNSKISTARIIKISYVKRSRNVAYYEFVVDNKKVSGKTLSIYDGKVGDEICVEYLDSNPDKNIYCHEKELETIYEDCILVSLKYLGIMLAIVPIYILGSIIFGNKKLLAEVTSRT